MQIFLRLLVKIKWDLKKKSKICLKSFYFTVYLFYKYYWEFKWALNWKECELFISWYTDEFSGYFLQSYVRIMLIQQPQDWTGVDNLQVIFCSLSYIWVAQLEVFHLDTSFSCSFRGVWVLVYFFWSVFSFYRGCWRTRRQVFINEEADVAGNKAPGDITTVDL